MKKKLLLIAKYIWVIAIVFFVTNYLYTHFDSILKIIDVIPHFNLFIAIISLLTAKVLLSYVALLSINYVGYSFSFYKIFSIYNITQLAKYIPGSIWQFVGKAGAYSEEGMHSKAIKNSILIEMLCVISTAFILGVFLVLTGDLVDIDVLLSHIIDYEFYYIIFALLFIIFLIYFYKKTFVFISLFKNKYTLNIKMLIVLSAVWMLLGMSFFITLTPYIENPNIPLYVNIVGIYALAYAIGFLVPFAPAGLGIREAVLVSALVSLLSTDQAIILVSLNRIIYILLEVIIVIALMQIKFYKKDRDTIQN